MDYQRFDDLAVALTQPRSRRRVARLLGVVVAGLAATTALPTAAKKRRKKPRKPTCRDGQQNGRESDIDCGGGTCQRCQNGKTCQEANDCVSGTCTGGQCVTCTLKDLCGSDANGACQCNEDFMTGDAVCNTSSALGFTVDDCDKCPDETESCVTINGLLFNCYRHCGSVA